MQKVVMKTSYYESQYGCYCDLLPGWTVTFKGDFQHFHKYVVESIKFYIDCARKDGDEYSSVFDGEYKVEYDMDAAALLAYYREFGSLAGLQTITGINQKQLAHYASGISKPRPKQVEKIKSGLRRLAQDIQMVTV